MSKRQTKKRRNTKLILILLAIIVVLVVAIAGMLVSYYNSMLSLITRPTEVENSLSDEELQEILGFVPETIGGYVETTAATEETEPKEKGWGKTGKIVNIMLVGQQSREGEDSKLSDTMILCTINKETKTLTLSSFLRDLYIQLPNYKGHICGQQRINVAYNLGWRWAGELGGMEMLDLLIYNNFGVTVDHNIEIDFESFIKIIELIGGVEVEMNADEAKYLNDIYKEEIYKEGTNLITGQASLHYARMRKSSPTDNDFKRTQRQRHLITQLVKKCMTIDAAQLNNMLKTVLPMIITDMSNEDITTYVMELLPLLPELKFESVQIPAEETYWGEIVNIGGYDSGVIKCNVKKNKELLMSIAEEPVTEPTEAAN